MHPFKFMTIVIAFMLLGLITACENRSDSETGKTSEVTSQDVKQKAEEAIDAAAQKLYQEKEAFQNQLEAKIDEYDQKLDELKAKTQAMSADAQTKINQKIAALEAQKDTLSKKAEELKTTSADAWKDMSAGIDKALEELDASYQEAIEKFK